VRFEDAFKQGLIQPTVEGVLERTGRIYGCMVCRHPTGWRKLYPDCPGVPVCSDECKDVLDEQEREVELAKASGQSSAA
jgi:hypothetical protein